jgi:four helix bundle protein
MVRETTKRFPKDELFVLSSQFRRAADSFVLNIAEGAGNPSKRRFARFLDYSIQSGFECLGCLDISLENKFIEISDHTTMAEQANELIAMSYGLKKSLFRS